MTHGQKNVLWGIEIDSVNMCLQLPDDKLHQVRKGLLFFKNRTHMKSPRQEQEELQSVMERSVEKLLGT